MPSRKKKVQVGSHIVVVGGKYGGRQGTVQGLTAMKARIQFDGEESRHLVDQDFLKPGFAYAAKAEGEQVTVVKGAYRGHKGTVKRLTTHMIYVQLDDHTCPRVGQSSVVCIEKRERGKRLPVLEMTTESLRGRTVMKAEKSMMSSLGRRYRVVSPTPSSEGLGEGQTARFELDDHDVEIVLRIRPRKPRSSQKGRWS